MKHRIVKLSGIVGLAALSLAIVSAPAQGRPLDRGHDRGTSSVVQQNFCGDLTVRIDDQFDVNFLFNSHGDGLFYDHQTIHDTTTYTNLATGKSITYISNFIQKDLKVTDNRDGTLTVLVLSAGSTKVYGPDGKLLFSDPGQTRAEILIDDAGTPTDPSDDQFIAFLGVVKGSTGRNDLQGRDFCDDLHQFTA
ncbi:MAG: hypothetical protein DLM58_05015 [Pseudonocardiales bacterium]|nr:MAG: hypothetical protein DLM58_05015 [Pseudonocardiales bacterium]